MQGKVSKIGGVFNGQNGFYGWWIVAGCFLLTFTGIGIAINSIGVFLKPVTESLGFDRGEFSLISLLRPFLWLWQPLMGKLLSKYNIRVVMGIATTLLALSFFYIHNLPNYISISINCIRNWFSRYSCYTGGFAYNQLVLKKKRQP